MKLRMLATILLLTIFLSTITCAENIIDPESGISAIDVIEIEVQENGFATITGELIVNNTSASLTVLESAEDITVYNPNGNHVLFSVQRKDSQKQIFIEVPESLLNSKITFSYSTQRIINKNASIWSLDFSAFVTPGRTIVKLDFPQASKIITWNTDILFTPVENGLWLYPQSDHFTFDCDYELTNVHPTGNDMNLYFFIAVLFIVIFVLVFYLFVMKKRTKDVDDEDENSLQKPQESKETEDKAKESKETEIIKETSESKVKPSILNILDDNERRIVEMLEQCEDEITQAYVYKSTGIPKATLSDVIRRLESRNIIDKRRDGRTNWIKLEHWVFSK